MNQNKNRVFIVIDDDRINNMICTKMIGMSFPESDIQTFLLPEEGLNYLQTYNQVEDKPNAILFLDINMPVLSGWDILKKMEDFPETRKNSIDTYMLSSSVGHLDLEKADNHPLVKGYISKPLTKAKLFSYFASSTVEEVK